MFKYVLVFNVIGVFFMTNDELEKLILNIAILCISLILLTIGFMQFNIVWKKNIDSSAQIQLEHNSMCSNLVKEPAIYRYEYHYGALYEYCLTKTKAFELIENRIKVGDKE
jgi:hypothetical protein